MLRTKVGAMMLLLLMITGCDWRSALGLRTPTPPPLRPGEVAGPDRDPLVQMEMELGVPIQKTDGPVLATGQQVVFYRYAKGKACGWGSVAYNPNRTVQARSESQTPCADDTLLRFVGGSPAGNDALTYGFVANPPVARVDVVVSSGQTRTATMAGDVFYLIDLDGGHSAAQRRLMRFIGYDARGKELFRRPAP